MTIERCRELGEAAHKAHDAFQKAFLAAREASENHIRGQKIRARDANRLIEKLDETRNEYDAAFKQYRLACAALGMDVEMTLRMAAEADTEPGEPKPGPGYEPHWSNVGGRPRS